MTAQELIEAMRSGGVRGGEGDIIYDGSFDNPADAAWQRRLSQIISQNPGLTHAQLSPIVSQVVQNEGWNQFGDYGREVIEAGVNPVFANQSFGWYPKTSTFDKMMSGFIPAAALAFGAGGLLGGLGGASGGLSSVANAAEGAMAGDLLGASGGLAGAGVDILNQGGIAGQGGGMSFFDSIGNFFSDPLGSIGDLFTPGASEFDPSLLAGIEDPIQALDMLDKVGGGMGATAGANALGFSSVTEALSAIDPSWVSGGLSLGSILNAGKSLFGGGGGGSSGGVSNALSGLFGGSLGGAVDLAARLAPGYFALNFAKDLSEPDLSRLTSLYDKTGSIMDPYSSAVMGNFDLDTGRQRRNLNTSLANRGVMGSSFGNFDTNTFNNQRDLARGELLGKLQLGGIGVQGGLANNILGAQQLAQKTQADLYGRAFDIFGRAVAPNTMAGLYPLR